MILVSSQEGLRLPEPPLVDPKLSQVGHGKHAGAAAQLVIAAQRPHVLPVRALPLAGGGENAGIDRAAPQVQWGEPTSARELDYRATPLARPSEISQAV